MKTVNFTQMKDGTKDEYLLLDEYEQDYINGTADRILNFMFKSTGIVPFVATPLNGVSSYFLSSFPLFLAPAEALTLRGDLNLT